MLEKGFKLGNRTGIVIYVFDTQTSSLISEFITVEDFKQSEFFNKDLECIQDLAVQVVVPLSEHTEARHTKTLSEYLAEFD